MKDGSNSLLLAPYKKWSTPLCKKRKKEKEKKWSTIHFTTLELKLNNNDEKNMAEFMSFRDAKST